MINVKDFGAVGDGVADDTGAIKDSLQYAYKKDTVWIPGGKYLVSEPIEIGGERICGEHHWRAMQGGSTLVASDGFGGDAVVKCTSNAGSLIDLMIDANGVSSGFHAFSMHGTTARVENVSVSHASDFGFHFEHSMVHHVSRCNASNNRIGFLIESSNGASYVGCSAAHNAETGFKVIKGSSSGSCTISDSISESNGWHGFDLLGDAAANGLYLTQVRLRDNWVEGNGLDGIRAEFAHGCDITGNRLMPGGVSASDRCIRLVQSRICTVRDNRAAASAVADWIRITDDSPVHPNIFENNWRLSDIVAQQLVVEPGEG